MNAMQYAHLRWRSLISLVQLVTLVSLAPLVSLVPWSPWSPWSSSFQVATVSVTQKAIAGRQRMLIHVSPCPAHKRLYKAEEGAARLVEVCDERVNRTN